VAGLQVCGFRVVPCTLYLVPCKLLLCFLTAALCCVSVWQQLHNIHALCSSADALLGPGVLLRLLLTYSHAVICMSACAGARVIAAGSALPCRGRC
jgi:hypothetical protein